MSEIFSQVVMIAREAGLVKLGVVAIDGSKVKANASKHKAMSYERMKTEEERLKREIAESYPTSDSVDPLRASYDPAINNSLLILNPNLIGKYP